MAAFDASQELEHLRNECRALEDEAGLTAIMERAREGRLFPLGAFGEKSTTQEYFADEYDYRREKTREAYFSVEDKEVRRKLIAAQRKVESRLRRSLEQDMIRANREVALAAAKARQEPWGKAALVAVGAVALGYSGFGTVGAIGGAVGGLFLGFGVVSNARSVANSVLAEATRELESARKEQEEQALMPEFFSSREELSGERDADLDRESAYANVLQAARGAA